MYSVPKIKHKHLIIEEIDVLCDAIEKNIFAWKDSNCN